MTVLSKYTEGSWCCVHSAGFFPICCNSKDICLFYCLWVLSCRTAFNKGPNL